MNIEDLIKQIADLNCSKLSQEAISHKTRKIVEEFNDNYQIVPKEQWCVIITVSEEINSAQTIGPFDSEEIANLFATIWNRKREEFIDKTIEANPDGDHYFPYMKAKPNKLDWSEKCNEIQTEIFEALKEL